MTKDVNYYCQLIGLANPYARYQDSRRQLVQNIQGWTGHLPFLGEVVETAKPELIVEVGSFLGQSAINMATVAEKGGYPTTIICADTWLGSEEHWRSDKCNMLDLFGRFAHGTSALYDQFVANVMTSGLEHRILPIPNTSATVAKLLAWRDIKADVVYIDASHEKQDVKNDIVAYRQLLKPGGILFGDDYVSWASVGEAVRESARELGMTLLVRDNNFWILR